MLQLPEYVITSYSIHYTKLYDMAANMDTVGTFEMALALQDKQLFTALHKHYTIAEWNSFLEKAPAGIENYIAVSTGTGINDSKKVEEIFKHNPHLKFICIDVANGYSEHFVQFVSEMRNKFPEKIIMAGNVVTGEMVEELLLAGADIIKVGIGPGSVCTTRVKTGVGYPQLSAIIECADAAHGLGGQIISDGGCSTPGDVSKAFGAGAVITSYSIHYTKLYDLIAQFNHIGTAYTT